MRNQFSAADFISLRDAAAVAGFKYGWAWDRYAVGRLSGYRDQATGRIFVQRASLLALLEKERPLRTQPQLRLVIDNTK